jgi:hypothetical protein
MIAGMVVIVLLSQAVVIDGHDSGDSAIAREASDVALPRPVEGVDFVRLSSTEFVFQKPPKGADWLVMTEGPTNLADFYRDGDKCTVDRNTERILIHAANDKGLSWPLEVPDPKEYVEMLKWDLAREKQAGMY